MRGFAALALILAACGGGTALTATTVAPTTTTEAVSTTAAPTTTTEAVTTTAPLETTTSEAPPPCTGLASAATPPAGASGYSSVPGDFDGDGADDLLIAYEDSGTWWIQIALSYGYASEIEVLGPAEAHGARSFGGAAEEVGYARVFSGASTDFVGFFFLAGCSITEAAVDGTGVAEFGVGGSVTHLDGVTCTDEGIVTTSASTTDGTSWNFITTRLDWVPGLGEFQTFLSGAQVLTSPADDATIFTAADYTC